MMTHLVGSSVTAFKEQLSSVGLHLCEIKPLSDLPADIWLGTTTINEGSICLIAHAGGNFWNAFKASGYSDNDPIDRYSADITEQALSEHFPNMIRQQLYPSNDFPIDLMALGRAFGWHHASPLGMGIHAQYGLWSAYRAVWWLDTDVVSPSENLSQVESGVDTQQFAPDICASCLTQACISACPGEALSIDSTPRLNQCADYRLSLNSQCQSTCISRVACPYAQEHRYDSAQLSYHYDLALSAIAAYRSIRPET